MGKIQTTWLLPGHSGRPCRHEKIYTKQNKKTNKVYSVMLCNPNTEWNESQLAQRTKFSVISSAISAWVSENKEKNTKDYQNVLRKFERQNKYSTLRGMIYGMQYATIGEDGKVTINVRPGSIPTSGGNTNSDVNPGGGSAPNPETGGGEADV